MAPQAKPATPNRSGRLPLWEALIALVAISLFARTVGFGWVYDDQMEIVLNSLIRSFGELPSLFLTTAWAGSGMETYLYRPLTLVTYTVNHQLSGLAPWSYHLVNVILHASVSVLVFRVGKLWGLSSLAAGLGGLLFAVHPTHVEVAAAVFGRKDLLATIFTLAMIFWHREARARGGWRTTLPVAAFACAMLSKEVGVVAVFLVAAHDWFLAEDRRQVFHSPRLANLYVAYVATLLLYVLVRNGVIGGVGVPDTFYMDNPLVAVGTRARMATALVVMGKGAALLALPLTLSPDYSFNAIPLVQSILDWRLLGALTLLALSVWALLIPSVRRTPIPLALTWYVLALLPTSNLLLTVGTIFGERLLYLAGVAFCLSAGMGFAWATKRYGTVATGATVVILATLSIQTIRYSGAWESDISLFQWATASVPESTKAHHKLGEELLRAGDLGGAVRSLKRSLEIAPDNEFATATLSAARLQISRTYLSPMEGAEAPTSLPQDPEVLYVLGQISQERGELGQAEQYWEGALAMDPSHPESLGDLGVLRLMEADTTAALRLLLRAVQGKPSLATAWYGLGRVYLTRGEMTEASRALSEFINAAGPRHSEQVRWARRVLAEMGGS